MKRLIFLLSCVVAFSNISAQGKKSLISRFVPNTVDIRSIGMGKTGSSGNTGSNAIFGNPSLLALQQNASIKLGSNLHFAFGKNEYTDQLSELSGDEVKYGYKPNFKFSHVSAAFPFQSNLSSVPFSFAFGAGYHNAIDLSSTRYLKRNSITLADFYQYENTERFRGGLNTISPAFAFGFFNRISAGISFNIGFGNTRYESTSVISDNVFGSESEVKAVIAGKGFSTSIGISGKPLENLTLGANITPPYKWIWDEIEVERKGSYPKEQEIAGGEFTIPLNFSIGCEYQLTESFSVALEYQTRPFESYELDADKSSSEESEDIADLESLIKAMNLKNGHVFHAGVEISVGHVPFRFGFFLEPYPLISQGIENDISKLSEKPINMIGGTFGFSAPISKNVFLELAAQYGLLKSTIVESDLSSSSSGLKEYEEKENHLRADLGFRVDLPSFSSNESANSDISAAGL